MHMNEYQKAAARSINPALNTEQVLHHALHGLASEVGELHGLFQKAFQGHPLDPAHMKKETGDALWMIAEVCTAMGWTLEDVAQTNIDKLKARYPEGFSADKSLHRKEGDI
jgi:NTP pyrophosphatase (non-canonical NTP hydrolase)